MTDSTYCKGCVYSFYVGGTRLGCGYILTTGKRRPCPPGEGCTVKQTKGRKNHMAKKPSFDTAVAARMLDDGLTTAEVAEALNVPVSTIRNFRTRHYSKQKPETDQPQELGAAPVDPPISGELPPDDDQSALPPALPEGCTPPPPADEPGRKPVKSAVGLNPDILPCIPVDPFQLTEVEGRALYKLVARAYVGHSVDSMDDIRQFAIISGFFARMDRIFGEEGK